MNTLVRTFLHVLYARPSVCVVLYCMSMSSQYYFPVLCIKCSMCFVHFCPRNVSLRSFRASLVSVRLLSTFTRQHYQFVSCFRKASCVRLFIVPIRRSSQTKRFINACCVAPRRVWRIPACGSSGLSRIFFHLIGRFVQCIFFLSQFLFPAIYFFPVSHSSCLVLCFRTDHEWELMPTMIRNS